VSTFQIFPNMEAIVINKVFTTAGVDAFDRIPAVNRPNEFAIIHLSGGIVLERHKWNIPDLHFDVYAESKSRAHELAQTIRQTLMDNEGSRWTHSVYTSITAFVSKVSDGMSIQWLPDPIEQPLLARYVFGLSFVCSP